MAFPDVAARLAGTAASTGETPFVGTFEGADEAGADEVPEPDVVPVPVLAPVPEVVPVPEVAPVPDVVPVPALAEPPAELLAPPQPASSIRKTAAAKLRRGFKLGQGPNISRTPERGGRLNFPRGGILGGNQPIANLSRITHTSVQFRVRRIADWFTSRVYISRIEVKRESYRQRKMQGLLKCKLARFVRNSLSCDAIGVSGGLFFAAAAPAVMRIR